MSFFGGIFDYVSSPFKSPQKAETVSANNSQTHNESFVTSIESPEPVESTKFDANTSTSSNQSNKENDNTNQPSYKLNCYNPNDSFRSALDVQSVTDQQQHHERFVENSIVNIADNRSRDEPNANFEQKEQRKAPRPTMDENQFTDYVDAVAAGVVGDLLDDVETSSVTDGNTFDATFNGKENQTSIKPCVNDLTYEVKNDETFDIKEASYTIESDIEHKLIKANSNEIANESFDNRQTIIPKPCELAPQADSLFEHVPDNERKLMSIDDENSFVDSRVTVLPAIQTEQIKGHRSELPTPPNKHHPSLNERSDVADGEPVEVSANDAHSSKIISNIGKDDDIIVIESRTSFDKIKRVSDKELKDLSTIAEESNEPTGNINRDIEAAITDDSIIASAPDDGHLFEREQQSSSPIRRIDFGDETFDEAVAKFSENISSHRLKHSTPVSESKKKSSNQMSFEDVATEADLNQLLKKREEKFLKQLKEIEAETAAEKARAEKEKKEKERLEETLTELRNFSDECRKQTSDVIAQLTKVLPKNPTTDTLEMVKAERDSALADNRAIENAFAELNSKYQTLREAEIKYREEVMLMGAKCLAMEKRATNLDSNIGVARAIAEKKLEKANDEIERLTKARDTDTIGLRAALKKSELQIDTLERTIKHKTREFEELTSLCDELIGGQEVSETDET